MPRCPFAVWDEISGPASPYTGGPFRIVHHTTEGSTYAGARAAFRAHRSDPHFTVDATEVHQHIDTARAARALRNQAGGVQTNRLSAVQIELVGFAGGPKDPAALANMARLCRWIEATHAVRQRWPGGPPRWSDDGRDPGGHDRSVATWRGEGGHYGHSQVPENTHWDPAYTPDEVRAVTPDMLAERARAWEEPPARWTPVPMREAAATIVGVVFTSNEYVRVWVQWRSGRRVLGERAVDSRAEVGAWLEPPLAALGQTRAIRLALAATVSGASARLQRDGRQLVVAAGPRRTGRGKGAAHARIVLVPAPARAGALHDG